MKLFFSSKSPSKKTQSRNPSNENETSHNITSSTDIETPINQQYHVDIATIDISVLPLSLIELWDNVNDSCGHDYLSIDDTSLKLFLLEFIKEYDAYNSSTLELQGHPNIIVDLVGEIFLNCTKCKNMQDVMPWLKMATEDQFKKQSSYCKLNDILLNSDISDADANVKGIQNRFIIILYTLSILCRWPNNQAILLNSFGCMFPVFILDLFKFLMEKLEDNIIFFNNLIGIATIPKVESLDSCYFILLCMIGLLRCSSSSISIDLISSISLDNNMKNLSFQELLHYFDVPMLYSITSFKEHSTMESIEYSKFFAFDGIKFLSSVEYLLQAAPKLFYFAEVCVKLHELSIGSNIYPSGMQLWRLNSFLQIELLKLLDYHLLANPIASKFCVQNNISYVIELLLSCADINNIHISQDNNLELQLVYWRSIMCFQLNRRLFHELQSSSISFDNILNIQSISSYATIMLNNCIKTFTLESLTFDDLNIIVSCPKYYSFFQQSDKESIHNQKLISSLLETSNDGLQSSAALNYQYQQDEVNRRCNCQYLMTSMFQDIQYHRDYDFSFLMDLSQSKLLNYFFDFINEVSFKMKGSSQAELTDEIFVRNLLSLFRIYFERSLESKSTSIVILQFYFLKYLYRGFELCPHQFIPLLIECGIIRLLLLCPYFLLISQNTNDTLEVLSDDIFKRIHEESLNKILNSTSSWYEYMLRYKDIIDILDEISSNKSKKLFHDVILRDSILFLILKLISFSINLKDAEITTKLLNEVLTYCIDMLKQSLSNDLYLQIIRFMTVIFDIMQSNQMLELYASLYVELTYYVGKLCKLQTSSMKGLDVTGDQMSSYAEVCNFTSGARFACIHFIHSVVECSPDLWIQSFLRKGSDKYVYSSMLRLALYPQFREVSTRILMRITQACASLELTITKSSSLISQYTALAHDVLRGFFNIIRNSTKQREAFEGYLCALSILECLIEMVTSAPSLSGLSNSWYSTIFLSYGPMTSAHKEFSWKHSYPEIFSEIFLSVDECMRYHKCQWSSSMKRHFLCRVLRLCISIMNNNDAAKRSFRKMLFTKQSSSSLSKTSSFSKSLESSSSLNQNKYIRESINLEDIIALVVHIESLEISSLTLVYLVDMMFDGSLAVEVVSSEDSNVIFNQIMDWKSDNIPAIANLNAIPLIVSCIPYCSMNVQSGILAFILKLVDDDVSTVNLFKCIGMNPSLFEFLLDLFPKISFHLYNSVSTILNAIGRNVITVSQLKKIFRLINSPNQKVRPLYTSILVESLNFMASNCVGSQYFLYFEGNSSGLLLPPLQKWRLSQGYSLSLWFSVSSEGSLLFHSKDSRLSYSFDKTNGKLSHSNKYLLSFRDESGIGFDIQISYDFDESRNVTTRQSVSPTYRSPLSSVANMKLLFTFQSSSLKKDVNSLEFDVQEHSFENKAMRQWNHLCISHLASTFTRKSEVTVSINGNLSKKSLLFPKYSDIIMYPLVGNGHPKFGGSKESAFCGKLGAIYFFSEAITESQMLSIYKLGPSYVQTFSDNERADALDKVFDGSLNSAIMLAFNPGIWKDRSLVDITPEKNKIKWSIVSKDDIKYNFADSDITQIFDSDVMKHIASRNWRNVNAFLLKGTHICVSNDMKDSFDCVGGVKVLLPLLYQMDYPIDKYDGLGNSASNTDVLFSMESLCSKTLQLIFTCLRDTAINKNFIQHGGFSLISRILERIDPQHIDVESLNVILKASCKITWNREWIMDIVQNLLGNFNLWIRCSYRVQKALFSHLLATHFSNNKILQESLTPQKLFDILLNLYSEMKIFPCECKKLNEVTSTSFKSSKRTRRRSILSNTNPVSVIGVNSIDTEDIQEEQRKFFVVNPNVTKLTKDEIDDIRAKIFQMLFTHTSAIDESVDVVLKELVSYISLEELPKYKIEGLQFLLRLISPLKPKFHDHILSSSVSSSLMNLLLLLVSNSNAKIRLYAIIAIMSIIQLASSCGRLPIQSPTHGAASRAELTFSDFETNDVTVLGHSGYTPRPRPRLMSQEISSPDLFRQSTIEKRELNLEILKSPNDMNLHNDIDAFSTLGIPVGSHFSFFPILQSMLSNAIQQSKGDVESIELQHEIAFYTIQLTMHGISCKFFVEAVEKLFTSTCHPAKSFKSANIDTNSLELSNDTSTNISTPQLESRSALFKLFASALSEEANEIIIPSPPILFTDSSITEEEFRLSSLDNPVEDFSCMKICIPGIFPLLVQFLKQGSISSSLRLKLLSRLLLSIQYNENIEVLLNSLKSWQSSLFDLLAYERSRMNSMEDKLITHKWNGDYDNPLFDNEQSLKSILIQDINKLKESTQVCALIFDVFGKILIYAMQFGYPAFSEMKVSRPFEIQSNEDVLNFNVQLLLEHYDRNKRIVGGNLVRETISLLRCLASGSSAINSRSIAYEILSRVLFEYESEFEHFSSIMPMIGSLELKTLKMKLFELNSWILSSVVFEFITVPPIQLARSPTKVLKRRSILIREDNSPRGHVLITQPFSTEKNIDSSNNRSRSCSNDDYYISNNKDEILQQHDMQHLVKSISKLRSYSQDSDISKATSYSGINSLQEDVIIRDNLDSKDFYLEIWKFMDPFMNFIDLIGTYESVNQLYDKKVKYSSKIIELIDRNMQFTLNKEVSSNSIRTMTSVIGLQCRLLVNIFILAIECFSLEDHTNSILGCLPQLEVVLNRLKENNKQLYEQEAIYIIARLSQVLNKDRANSPRLWFREGLRLFASLLATNHELILGLLNLREQDEFSKTKKNIISEFLSKTISGDNKNIEKFVRTPMQIEKLIAESLAFLETIDNSKELQVQVLRLTLSLPPETEFEFKHWKILIEQCLANYDVETEEFHSYTSSFQNGIQKYLENAKEQERGLAKKCIESLDDFKKHIHQQDIMRQKELIRVDESLKRKCESLWMNILQEIANERGPWGTGISNQMDYFWILDSSEDNSRMRCLFKVNPFGNRHAASSQLAQNISPEKFVKRRPSRRMSIGSIGAISTISTPVTNRKMFRTDERVLIDSVRDELDFDSTPLIIPSDSPTPLSSLSYFNEIPNEDPKSHMILSPLELWKDLNKFKKKTLPVSIDELSIDEDSISEEESINENESNVLNESDYRLEASLDLQENKILFSASCEIITPSSNYSNHRATGTISVSMNKIIFIRDDLDVSNSSSSATQPIKKSSSISTMKAEVLSLASQLQSSIAAESQWAYQTISNSQWETFSILEMLQRYYLLRYVAIEIFFMDRTSIFINFNEKSLALAFQQVIRRKVRPPFLLPYLGKKPAEIALTATPAVLLRGSTITQNLTSAWINREISNFDYLQALNKIAGRTYNDLGQYPIFPWVLADYSSSELNLRDPNVFRDLRYPMGGQSLSQRQVVNSKYNDLNSLFETQRLESEDANDQTAMPPFHFGTHYSVAGFVIWFMIRCEPYTSLHIQLQDGKIDKTDRLFDSIEATWKGCTTNQSDVKELIPELFYLPECLLNINHIDFGTTQRGRKVDDVVLPAWAKTAYDFIHVHREALESDYVSMNLHHWIDLIFGYKQRPPYLGGHEASVDACNIFYHLTYENAVDLDSLRIQDPVLYDQYVCQITEFGQTPAQLFSKPHPMRKPFKKIDVIWPIASIVRGVHTIAKNSEFPEKPKGIINFKLKEVKVSNFPILFISESLESDKMLLTIDSSRVIGYHSWQVLSPDVVPPFKLKVDTSYTSDSPRGILSQTSFGRVNSNNGGRENKIGVPFAAPVGIIHQKYDKSKFHEIEKTWTQMKISHYYNYEKRLRETASSDIRSTSSKLPTSSLNSTSIDFYIMRNIPSEDATISDSSISTRSRSSTQDFYEVNTSTMDSRIRSSSDSYEQSDLLNQRLLESKTGLSTSSKSTTHAMNLQLLSGINSKQAFENVQDPHLSSQLFAIIPEHKLLLSCGHWDKSIRVTAIESGRIIESAFINSDVVTCISVAKDLGCYYIVAGSRDCTIVVFTNHFQNKNQPVLTKTPVILYGHDDMVTTVSVQPDLNVIVSGSADGSIIIHSLRDYSYLRTIVGVLPRSIVSPSEEENHNKSSINWIGVSKERYIVVYSAEDRLLRTYSINGELLASKIVCERLYSFLFSEDGTVLLTGGDSCLVVMRWVRTLELANDGPRKGLDAIINGESQFKVASNNSSVAASEDKVKLNFNSPIRSLYFTKFERHLIVGMENGEIRILSQDSDYLRDRLQRKLIEIGIL